MILKSVNNYNKITINCDKNYNKIPRGRGIKSQNFKSYMKLYWEFQVGGGSNQKICVCVCVGGRRVWIFYGTPHCTQNHVITGT